MHNAPPVAFPVGRFVWGRAAGLLMALLSVCGLLFWQVQAQTSSAQIVMAWAFWAVCVGGAAFWTPRQTLASGALFWSGESWFWQTPDGDDHGLELSVALDFGHALLLFVRWHDGQGQARGPWVCAWLSQTAMPSKWHGFRCAVYSRPETLAEPDVAASRARP